MLLPHPRVKVSIVGSLRDREVACSASDRQGPNFESCVWRTVSSQSSHHPQEVLLAQFSLYVHKGGLKPDSFHFFSFSRQLINIQYGAMYKLTFLQDREGGGEGCGERVGSRTPTERIACCGFYTGDGEFPDRKLYCV